MKVMRNDMLNGLEAVKPGLAGKDDLIEQSGCFVFQGGRVATYNDVTAVIYPLDLGMECAVDAAALHHLIRRSPEDSELECSLEKGEFRVTNGRRYTAGIRTEAEVRLPLSEIGAPDKWAPLPADWIEAAEMCLVSVGRDANRPVLSCVHFISDIKTRAAWAESADGFRATRRMMRPIARAVDLAVAEHAVRALRHYTPTKWGVTDSWIHFVNDAGVTYAVRRQADPFPDLNVVFDDQGAAASGSLPDGATDALERARGFCVKNQSTATFIRMELKANVLTVSARGDAGWFRERLTADWKGEACAFDVSPQFLAEALTLIRNFTVVDGRRLLMRGEGFIHVLGLVTTDEAAGDAAGK